MKHLRFNQYFLIEIKTEIDKKTGEQKLVRKYSTPGFLDCIERLAKGLPIHDENPNSEYIVLSPGDIVYVPEEGENINQIDWSDVKVRAQKIYIMRSCSNGQCFFIPTSISRPIVDTAELGANNKSERAWNNKMIKENFIKLKVDRLGNIIPPKKNLTNVADPQNLISEPDASYFTEPNESDAKAKAELSPQQHLINVTERIQHTYADELRKPMDKTLKFRND